MQNPVFVYPQRDVEHSALLSQEHLILFRTSGGAFFTSAGTITSIHDSSSPKGKTQVLDSCWVFTKRLIVDLNKLGPYVQCHWYSAIPKTLHLPCQLRINVVSIYISSHIP